jgi:hypothetical protein
MSFMIPTPILCISLTGLPKHCWNARPNVESDEKLVTMAILETGFVVSSDKPDT